MYFRERVLRGAFWSMVNNWGRQAASLLILLALARLLTAVEFGLFAIAMVIVVGMQVFLEDCIGEAVLQRADLEPGHLDSAFWLNAGAAVLAAGAVVAGSGAVAALFGQPGLSPLLDVLAIGFVLSGLTAVYQAVLRRKLLFKVLALRSILAIVLGGAVGTGMALADFGVWSLAGQQLTERAVGFAVLFWKSDWQPRFAFSLQRVRELMPYTASIGASRGIMFLYAQVDRFLIGLLLGPVALGVYSLSQRVLVTVQTLVTEGLSAVALATFCRFQHDPPGLRSLFYAGTEATAILAFPAFAGLAVVAPEAIPLIFGPRWADSGLILQITALFGIPRVIQGFSAAVARATGRPNWYVVQMGLGLVVFAGVVLALVDYGILAIAAGLLAGEVLMIPVNIWIVRRLIGIRVGEFLGRLAPPALAALAMVVGVELLKPALAAQLGPALALIAAILAGAAVYTAVMGLAYRGRLRQLVAQFRAIRAPAADA